MRRFFMFRSAVTQLGHNFRNLSKRLHSGYDLLLKPLPLEPTCTNGISKCPRWEGALVHEMSNLHPNGRILRRRIAWLLGKWVNKVRYRVRAAF